MENERIRPGMCVAALRQNLGKSRLKVKMLGMGVAVLCAASAMGQSAANSPNQVANQSSGVQPGQSVAAAGAAAPGSAANAASGGGPGATAPTSTAAKPTGSVVDAKATGSGTESAKADKSAVPAAALPPLIASLNNARDLYRAWKLKEALDAYNNILKTTPDATTAYVGIARVDLEMGNPADAYVAASKAVQMAPGFVPAQVAMGEVLFRQGKIWDATVQFKKIIKSDAEDARAYLGLAHVFFTNSNYRHGVYLLDRAHELDPDDPEIQRQWIFTLPRKERIEALKKFLDNPDSDEDRDLVKKHLAELEDAENEKHTCHLVTQLDHTEVPLKMLQYSSLDPRAVGVDVHMGRANAMMLLDTGAHGFVIARRIAEKAGVQRLRDDEIGGVGDYKGTHGYYGAASSIKIGDLEFADCEVFVVNDSTAYGRRWADGGGCLFALPGGHQYPGEKDIFERIAAVAGIER
jgi:tetratricopeptide (TPR) repeat protein